MKDPIVKHRKLLSFRAKCLKSLEFFFPTQYVPTQHGESAKHEYRKANGTFVRHIESINGVKGLRVLDFGCGWGGETVWLAERAAYAAGCDVKTSSLKEAREFAAQSGRKNVEFFLVEHKTLPFEDNSFDAVFSTDVFEHVLHPHEVLKELFRVLKPGGALLTTFGPLLYSPHGYHLFRVTQVPFAHLIFGLKPIVELRNLTHHPINISSWRELDMNQITYEGFRGAVLASGFQIQKLKRVAVKGCRLLASLPILSKYFTTAIDCHVTKPL